MSDFELAIMELRKHLATVMIGLSEQCVTNINAACDAIDSIHAELERENKAVTMKYIDANRRSIRLEQEREDLRRELADSIALPKDANGEVIHIDDEVRQGRLDWVHKVNCISFRKNGKVSVSFSSEHGCGVDEPGHLIHCQPDSWKRIIEDATALGAEMGRRTTQVDDLVARCEALAGNAS